MRPKPQATMTVAQLAEHLGKCVQIVSRTDTYPAEPLSPRGVSEAVDVTVVHEGARYIAGEVVAVSISHTDGICVYVRAGAFPTRKQAEEGPVLNGLGRIVWRVPLACITEAFPIDPAITPGRVRIQFDEPV